MRKLIIPRFLCKKYLKLLYLLWYIVVYKNAHFADYCLRTSK